MPARVLLSIGLGAALIGCSRSGLPSERGPGDTAGAGAGSPVDCTLVTVGDPLRHASSQQATFGSEAIDTTDDLYLRLGGLDANDDKPGLISATRLGTGESFTLDRAGDSSIVLGAFLRTTWDPTFHRLIGLGGAGDFPDNPADMQQVFAVTVSGTTAEIVKLPDFPQGTDSDVPLAAAVDTRRSRLLVAPEKGSVSGPQELYALDLEPGKEAWSLLGTDDQAELESKQFISLSYDPAGDRLIGVADDFVTEEKSIWTFSLSDSFGWKNVPGTLPPSLSENVAILGVGLPLVWDPAICSFVIAISDDACLYEVWKIDVSDTFTATALGVAPQATVRYGRGPASYDLTRHRFVFPGGFDCQFEHDYVSASVDFLPLVVAP